MQKTEKAHRGSTLDSFLHEEGIYHQVTTAAVLEVFAEEAREEMARQKRSQSWLARKMGTSRAVLNRLFRPKPSGVTVSTLVRFADALDKDIRIELIDRPAENRKASKSRGLFRP
jgi:antitoxin HicB